MPSVPLDTRSFFAKGDGYLVWRSRIFKGRWNSQAAWLEEDILPDQNGPKRFIEIKTLEAFRLVGDGCLCVRQTQSQSLLCMLKLLLLISPRVVGFTNNLCNLRGSNRDTLGRLSEQISNILVYASLIYIQVRDGLVVMSMLAPK